MSRRVDYDPTRLCDAGLVAYLRAERATERRLELKGKRMPQGRREQNRAALLEAQNRSLIVSGWRQYPVRGELTFGTSVTITGAGVHVAYDPPAAERKRPRELRPCLVCAADALDRTLQLVDAAMNDGADA